MNMYCASCYPLAIESLFVWMGFSLCEACMRVARKEYEETGELKLPIIRQSPKED